MRLSRRQFLQSAAAAAPAASLFAAPALAQKVIFESLNLFVPAGAGGGWDGVARAIDQVARSTNLIGSATVENVGGAGGTVGLPRFINQRRGQSNALMISGGVMTGAVITNKSPVGLGDVTPIARLTEEAGVIVVSAKSPHTTFKDFAEALRANPGLPVGGGSAGGIDHMTLGLLIKTLGGEARRASYVAFPASAQAQATIITGQVAAGISGYSEFAEQIRAGQMRALATTGEVRTPGLDLPTLKELGYDVVLTNWRGIFAPPGMSAADTAALVRFAESLYAQPAWKELLRTRRWDDAFLVGDSFKRFLDADQAKMRSVLQDIGLA